MRPWLAADEDSRAWVSTIHRRGEFYARSQLWQVRQALFGRMRRDLSGSTDPDRIRYLSLPERPLLDAVLRASRALDRPVGPGLAPGGPGSGPADTGKKSVTRAHETDAAQPGDQARRKYRT